MDDLVTFLRARIDEDDLTVREANTSPEMVTGIPRSYAKAPVAIHIARFANPDRALREIEAKREMLRLAAQSRKNANLPPETPHGPSGAGFFVKGYAAAMEHTLRLLAAVYADHPDYRPEWAPSAD